VAEVSKEIRVRVQHLSIEDVPEGKMLVGFYVPVEHAKDLPLGLNCIITVPEARTTPV
jgi:hypothetical protein